jgi:hypothetical protein
MDVRPKCALQQAEDRSPRMIRGHGVDGLGEVPRQLEHLPDPRLGFQELEIGK